MDMILDYCMAISAEVEGTKMEVEMDMDVDSTMKICPEPLGTYTKLKANIAMSGMKMDNESEVYTVVEDGKVVNYAGTGGVWAKEVSDKTVEDILKSTQEISFDEKNLKIDDSVKEYNGQKVICLKSTISGDNLNGAVGSALSTANGSTGAAGAMDFSSISCDVVIYVNPETYLPVAEEIAINGMDEFLKTSLAATGEKVNVETKSCKATVEFKSYDKAEAITVPQEVLNAVK